MHAHAAPISRRRLLQLGAVASAAGLAACTAPLPSLTPRASPRTATSPSASAEATSAADPSATPSPSPSPRPQTGRVLFRDGALADGRSASAQRNVSILVEAGRISWIRPA
jgi:hypothetical protein